MTKAEEIILHQDVRDFMPKARVETVPKSDGSCFEIITIEIHSLQDWKNITGRDLTARVAKNIL